MNKREIQIKINKIKRKINFRSGLNFRRKRVHLRGGQVRYYTVWVLEIVGVILLAFLLTKGFGMRVVCSGNSMEETIPENASLWVDKVVYHIKSPSVGDVIAFLPGGNANASYNIKRIVAVPGDKVLIENGRLYVNGKLVEGTVKEEDIKEAGRATDEITLGEEEYFVLGDNANNSEDSRYETVGNVKKSEIYGKVWFSLSFREFGLIE